MNQSLEPVARAIANFVAAQTTADDELGAAIRHMAQAADAAVPNPQYRATADGRAYAGILASALSAAATSPLAPVAEAMAPVSELMPWHYSYPAAAGETDLSQRIAFAEIAGPKGPLVAHQARLGFTLMAPHTFYPMHAHPAVELYLVVSGHAAWLSPDYEAVVPPGDFVLHRTGQPHAMRTESEALLAIYAWQGDLNSPSVYL